MNLPKQYEWLNSVKGLPRTIKLGLDLYGVQEVVGRGSNATIIVWRDELNGAGPAGKPIVKGFSDDDIAWCGLAAAIVAYRRMKRIEEVVKDPLWARNWAKYGVSVKQPGLGDILVFRRGNGGHVAFYVGEDADCYHCLGGNQSNKFCIARMEKTRLLAARRPPYVTIPKGVKPYLLAATGRVSTNEA